MNHKVMNIVKKPSLLFLTLGNRGVFNWIPDEIYLRLAYKIKTGKRLNLKNPKSFNEKLQWLKLYDRNPEYSKLVDKYEAKKIIGKRIGEEHIIPTIGIWDNFDKIDFSKLPEQFVLKCTHNSGGIIVCQNKNTFDIRKARCSFYRWLHKNYYWGNREYPYKNIRPRIIAEKYMTDESGVELKDYKVHNFAGKPLFIQVDYGRFSEHKRNLYTTDWKFMDASILYPNDASVHIPKPVCLSQMLKLAEMLSKEILSKEISYVRTDFYCIEDRVYFGEMTFYHGSGYEKFVPESFGRRLGNYILLSGN